MHNASCSTVQQIESCQSLSAIQNRSLLLATAAQQSDLIYNYRLYRDAKLIITFTIEHHLTEDCLTSPHKMYD